MDQETATRFVGAYVTPTMKNALLAKSEADGLSESQLIRQALAELLGLTDQVRKPGRRPKQKGD